MKTNLFKLTPITDEVIADLKDGIEYTIKVQYPFDAMKYEDRTGGFIKQNNKSIYSIFLPVSEENDKKCIEFAEWVLQKEFIPINELEETGEYWSVLFDGRYTIQKLLTLFNNRS